jgi:hypothetical protein
MVFSAVHCWTLDQAERNPELLALAVFGPRPSPGSVPAVVPIRL